MSWEVRQGDCLSLLKEMPAGIVQTVVTSPPYWGLRDYGTATWDGGDAECDHIAPRRGGPVSSSSLGPLGQQGGEWHERTFEATQEQFRDNCGKCGAKRIDSQLGLEPTPDEYVSNLVNVFREVRRVLRDDGTVWLNLGDSYFGIGRGQSNQRNDRGTERAGFPLKGVYTHETLKGKDLCGIPWRVAFALQADGWWLRSDIVWSKPNPMPESVTDRPTRSHEYIFLLTKSARYFWDADAIREDGITGDVRRPYTSNGAWDIDGRPEEQQHGGEPRENFIPGRNKRSVWTVATQPYSEAHFATFPPKLIEPCILAGSSPNACGECGAPWERVVERTTTKEGEGYESRMTRLGADFTPVDQPNRSMEQVPIRYDISQSESKTVGWQSTCTHPNDSGRSTVLDPFCGSGTTGMVALRHDRSFIGLELNPEYVEMARHRIRDDAPLLNYGLEAA